MSSISVITRIEVMLVSIRWWILLNAFQCSNVVLFHMNHAFHKIFCPASIFNAPTFICFNLRPPRRTTHSPSYTASGWLTERKYDKQTIKLGVNIFE